VVHEIGSIVATGGSAVVNVTESELGEDGAVVEGGLLDGLMPRTREDWFKLAIGAIVGFLLGRRLK